MATEKQIAANRQNARSSTGPRTEYGKLRSRRNAMRHGLTAETVIDVLEDPAAYRALQRAIHADYRPRTNFELELVARLVSLLWRLRRAVAIESGLLSIQAKRLHNGSIANAQSDQNKLGQFYALFPALAPRSQINCDQANGALSGPQDETVSRSDRPTVLSAIANSFMKVASREGTVFDRLGRYEIRLWRQAVQTILLLNAINRAPKDASAEGKYYRRRQGMKRHTLWPPFTPSDTDLKIS
jgi:hypothetical protein